MVSPCFSLLPYFLFPLRCIIQSDQTTFDSCNILSLFTPRHLTFYFILHGMSSFNSSCAIPFPPSGLNLSACFLTFSRKTVLSSPTYPQPHSWFHIGCPSCVLTLYPVFLHTALNHNCWIIYLCLSLNWKRQTGRPLFSWPLNLTEHGTWNMVGAQCVWKKKCMKFFSPTLFWAQKSHLIKYLSERSKLLFWTSKTLLSIFL